MSKIGAWSALCGLLALWGCSTQEQGRCLIERRGASSQVVRVSGDCRGRDFSGSDLSQANLEDIQWGDNVCPDGTRSQDHGDTCLGHLSPQDAAPDMGEADDGAPDEDLSADLPVEQAQDLSEDLAVDGADDLADAPVEPQDGEEGDAPEDLPGDLEAPEDACQRNACGGCGALEASPGDTCGDCGLGSWGCEQGALVCQQEIACPPTCQGNEDCDSSRIEHCQRGFCTTFGVPYFRPTTYMQGSSLVERGHRADERQRRVRMTRGVLVLNNEVTDGDWAAEDPDAVFEECGDFPQLRQCPATRHNWYEALAYLNSSSYADGLEPCYYDPEGAFPYSWADAALAREPTWPQGLDCQGWRLPTEAEWEYFARADQDTEWFCGDNESCLELVAWHQGNSGGQAHDTMSKQPNDFRLFDTAGNVWEWVWDRYGPYEEGPVVDPTGPEEGSERVIRGGCFRCSPQELRSAHRGRVDPTTRRDDIGLRVVRTWRGPEVE